MAMSQDFRGRQTGETDGRRQREGRRQRGLPRRTNWPAVRALSRRPGGSRVPAAPRRQALSGNIFRLGGAPIGDHARESQASETVAVVVLSGTRGGISFGSAGTTHRALPGKNGKIASTRGGGTYATRSHHADSRRCSANEGSSIVRLAGLDLACSRLDVARSVLEE